VDYSAWLKPGTYTGTYADQMKALTAAEMREVDRLTTERFGIPGLQLMEAAGKSCAEVFLEHYGHSSAKPPGRVCVLCGKGNNGGDGFVVARYLLEEAEQVEVYLFGKPEELRGDAARNYERWREGGGSFTAVGSVAEWKKAWASVASAEIIFDALLGTGIRGPVKGLLGEVMADVNRLSRNATAAKPAWVVAVDMPSGLPSDGEAAESPVIRAHLTVTFTAPKVGQLISRDAAACGKLEVRAIGSPEALVEEVGQGKLRWAGPDEFAGLPLVRATDSNKGMYGHVLLVAGAVGKTGAAVMAGHSALRGGAGLVTVAVPEHALPAIAASRPELMTEGLAASREGSFVTGAKVAAKFLAILKGKTVLGVGPGVGTSVKTQEFVRGVVTKTNLPMVLDADGLNAFAGKGALLRKKKTRHLVLTPHPGEMARLRGKTTAAVQSDRVSTAMEAAKSWNAYVLLKGFNTVMAAPDGRVFVNLTGNPGLAKGGSGDVLTGLLTALIAQFGTEDLLRVMALGAYLHGAAAELLAQNSDASGMLASEVADAVPFARRKLLQELRERG
jgi:ADP-dependent NAD(P)H-hydrate dehydratase / NAD(P)H-hydrate epimerase